MKKLASPFLKKMVSLISSITKSKSLTIKAKMEAMKARLIFFSFLKNKKLPLRLGRSGSISHKIHALLLGGPTSEDDDNVSTKVIDPTLVDDEDDKYPDLRHFLFEQEDELDLGNPDDSVIDLVKNSKEHDGEDFSLEDEIDHVADLFIMKFHRRMRLQKLESFKRYQDMLERST